MPLTQCETTEQIGVITLDHPARRNALSKALIDEVIAALDDSCRFGQLRPKHVAPNCGQ